MGEDHLLLSFAPLLGDNTAVSLAFVQCQMLSKEAFDAILELCPEYLVKLRPYVVRLAVLRGIMRHTEQLRRAAVGTEVGEASADVHEQQALRPGISTEMAEHVDDSRELSRRSRRIQTQRVEKAIS